MVGKKICKYLYIGLIALLFQAQTPLLAIEDTKTQVDNEIINLESADSDKKFTTNIDFDDILLKAKEHSYDLKIADFNMLISKYGIMGARSEYFPKLILSAGTEYTKNFNDNRDTSVISIGENFINPYTRYQSVMGITLSYNLFDFGVRKANLEIAKEDVILQELKKEEQLQELNLNLVDTYSKILMLKKQITYRKQILTLQKINLEYKKRLYNAGEISKTELNDAYLKVELEDKKINEIYSTLAQTLKWLSFYTGEEYSLYDLTAADMERFDTLEAKNVDYTKSIAWRIKEIELSKKDLEIIATKRANFPKVNAYSRYYLYGSDTNSYSDSFDEIKPSNFTIGGSISMMAFDGLKNRANIHQVTLEYKRLEVERDKAIAQLGARLAALRSNLIYLDEQINNNLNMIKELTDKQKSFKRLVAKKIAMPIEENEANIELLEQKIEFEKNNITAVAITNAIKILTTY